MGSLTPNFSFYEPAESEFIDVDIQLNGNWQIADAHVKRLLEYEFTTSATPSPLSGVKERSRYFKHYSNSLMAYFPSQGIFYQDPRAYVSTWNKAGSRLIAPYAEHPDYPVGWRLIRNADNPNGITEVEWTGAFWIGGSPMPLNTNDTIMILPADTIPVVSKYFTQNAGNTTNDYSIARVGIFSGAISEANMQYKRYGAASGNTTDENRVELTGIKYSVEVAA